MSIQPQQESANPEEPSPFGGSARLELTLPTAHVAEMYRDMCGVDVRAEFDGAEFIHRYECSLTGYRFWRPEGIAGSEQLYAELSKVWPDYYRTDRWEYSLAQTHLRSDDRILEVGCGRGYFLASTEGRIKDGLGLELNTRAIEEKVTSHEVRATSVEALADSGEERFDSAWSFQVLEHVSDPASFIRSCLTCLKPGGLLGLSTPNSAHVPFVRRDDAFDLPPHHVGHFSESVYRRVAEQLGVEVVAIHLQVRGNEAEAVTELTRRSLPYRVARRLSRSLFNASYRWSKEPGPGILAVFRKPR